MKLEFLSAPQLVRHFVGDQINASFCTTVSIKEHERCTLDFGFLDSVFGVVLRSSLLMDALGRVDAKNQDPF
jgi:hypothetical protein